MGKTSQARQCFLRAGAVHVANSVLFVSVAVGVGGFCLYSVCFWLRYKGVLVLACSQRS